MTPTEASHDQRCPICGAPATPEYRPFCSRRCADVDLSRWLRGAYAIAGRVEEDGAGKQEEEPAAGGSDAATGEAVADGRQPGRGSRRGSPGQG